MYQPVKDGGPYQDIQIFWVIQNGKRILLIQADQNQQQIALTSEEMISEFKEYILDFKPKGFKPKDG